MKVLFLSKYKWPHVGGVEKHIFKISSFLERDGHNVTIVSSNHIKIPALKIIGLVYVWTWVLKHRKWILDFDIIHIHDVFIWYLPIKLIYPFKKVYVTYHGWEGIYPIPLWNLLNKRIANHMVSGSISVGRYINKYYRIKSNFIIYGGVDRLIKNKVNKSLSCVYLGRLEKDTGIEDFLKYVETKMTNIHIYFVGDGPFSGICKKYGRLVGNVSDPSKYLKFSRYVVPSGYLSYWESLNYNCIPLIFPNNKLKRDYWSEVKKIKKIPKWIEVYNVYLKLWQL